MSILDRALRLGEGKQFKQYAKRVERINGWEPELELLDDDELRAQADALRERARNGEPLDDLLPETFAVVRETSRRTMGMRHFDVQMIGGMVLHAGSIAEMKTGEGKTLTGTLAVALNALAGNGVHVVTVNDYLARRDAEWMSPLYKGLGLSIGVLQNMQPYQEKRAAYASDITYGTNSEFGFDYLRDNMATSLEEKVQHGGRIGEDGKPIGMHHYAIVDEVDNILIDEARTPLIISGAPEQAADFYVKFAKLAPLDDAGQAARGHGPEDEEGVRRRLRLRVRREAQDRLGDRARRREGRALPRHRQPLQGRERPARQPPDPVAQGRVALQARRRLRGGRRRGQDHRRVHGPHPRRPALVGGPAPGGGGEGGRPGPGGEPDARHDHAAELLPHVRQARGHDRHGHHRGQRVHEDLQAAGRADPDEHADGPRRPQRPGLQDQGRQVGRRRARDRRAPRAGPAGPRRHHLRRGLRDLGRELEQAAASRTRSSTPSPSSPSARARSSPRPGSPARSRSPRTWRAAASTSSSAATPSTSRSSSWPSSACGPAIRTTTSASRTSCRRSRPASRRAASGRRGRRPVHRRHRAPRVAPDRQPAARPLRPPGRPGRVALLPLRRGRPRAPVRRRPHLPDPGPARPRRRGGRGGADRGEDALEADRERTAQGRGAELPHPQARPRVRRRDEPAARDRLPVPRPRAGGPGHGRHRARPGRRGHRAAGRGVHARRLRRGLGPRGPVGPARPDLPRRLRRRRARPRGPGPRAARRRCSSRTPRSSTTSARRSSATSSCARWSASCCCRSSTSAGASTSTTWTTCARASTCAASPRSTRSSRTRTRASRSSRTS